MSKVLLIVTSHQGKPTRIYTGSAEWTDGWQFPDNQEMALRVRSSQTIRYLNKLDDLLAEAWSEDTIVWIKGKAKPDFPKSKFNQILGALLKAAEVYLIYHDEFIYDLVASDHLEQLSLERNYGLGASESQFKKILRTEGGKTYLDAKADFDSIFKAFFLIPYDIFGFVEHKIVGILSPVDIDLQELQERKFSETYWKSMIQDYQSGKATEKLDQCRRAIYNLDFYQATPGLEALYLDEQAYADGDAKQTLVNKWQELKRLLPQEANSPDVEPLYSKAEKVFEGLANNNKALVQENLFDFRQWFSKIKSTIDELKSIILEVRHKNTGNLT